LEAKGESLAWETFIPSPVPDELNLYKAPGMRARFSRMAWRTNRGSVFSLPAWINNPPVTLDQLQAMPETMDDEAAAPARGVSRERLREWFAQQDEEYRLLVEACARPQVRFDADYTNPAGLLTDEMDMPNFVNLRLAVQALASHASLSLVDGQQDVAVLDLFRVRRLADLSGSSPMVVGAMVRVAIMSLYAEAARDAIHSGLLTDANIASIQEQIRDVNLLADFTRSWRAERATQVHFMTLDPEEAWDVYQALFAAPAGPFWRFTIDDWNAWYEAKQFKREIRSRRAMMRSLIVVCQIQQEALNQLEVTKRRIHASASSQVFSNMLHTFQQNSGEHRLAGILLPNFSRAALSVGRAQVRCDQLYVACALERHRLRHGSYPGTLEALLPGFIDRIPNDLFADQPLQYRRNADGRYDLWSVGWDETDDNGQPGLDWVWTSPKR
jgi:hypothetical protein